MSQSRQGRCEEDGRPTKYLNLLTQERGSHRSWYACGRLECLSVVTAGLKCRVCKFKVGALCFHPKEHCEANVGQSCETVKAYIGKVPLFSKYGCTLTTSLCNTTDNKDTVFDVSYNRTCCETNLCNAAGSPPSGLPLLSGLGAVLGLWLLK